MLILWILFAAFATTAIFSHRAIAASPPRIEYIEKFSTNMVLIHFDTEANRTYFLQHTTNLSVAADDWEDIYEAPELPFPNHYVIVHYRTNAQGFYRLKVTR